MLVLEHANRQGYKSTSSSMIFACDSSRVAIVGLNAPSYFDTRFAVLTCTVGGEVPRPGPCGYAAVSACPGGATPVLCVCVRTCCRALYLAAAVWAKQEHPPAPAPQVQYYVTPGVPTFSGIARSPVTGGSFHPAPEVPSPARITEKEQK